MATLPDESGAESGPVGWQDEGEARFAFRWERWADVPESNRREIAQALAARGRA
jgi:hypothetical protein